jgi:hypothetical protein
MMMMMIMMAMVMMMMMMMMMMMIACLIYAARLYYTRSHLANMLMLMLMPMGPVKRIHIPKGSYRFGRRLRR